MLNSIVMACFITIIIFIIVENFKKDIQIQSIHKTNDKIRDFISEYLGEIKSFDIFIVQQLREEIYKDFIKLQKIHLFELMMIDSQHLQISYEINGIREDIEVSTEWGIVEIRPIKGFDEINEY